MKINICKNYYPLNSKTIEKKYKVSYIGDFCIKDKNNNWTQKPVSIYYQDNPDLSKGHSNYLGVYIDYIFDGKEFVPGHVYLTDGQSAFLEGLQGIVADDGEIVISCYRHDYRTSSDDSVFIDGGRDYIRSSAGAKIVNLKIIKDKIVIDNDSKN